MIASKGLRWSGQTIGVGRRRLDFISARQFSSSVHHGPRISPLSLRSVTSVFKSHTRSRPIDSLRNGGGIRFASTAPVETPTPASPSITPLEAAATSAPPTPVSEFTTSLDSVTDLASESIYNIPEGIGYLKALGLDYGYGPTSIIQWALEHVHIFAGTPWWVSIGLTAVLVRALLFKPYIMAADNSAKLATVQPLTAPITAQMQAASQMGDSTLALAKRGELQRIHARAGIKIWKNFVPMVQIFSGAGTFILLRGMSKLPVPGLETGGILWLYNLTIPDPYWILPLATSAILHIMLKQGGEMGITTATPHIMNVMVWGMPILSFFFTFWLPAAVQFSFLISSLCSFGQSTLLRQTWFRDYFKMTPLPTKTVPKEPSPYPGSRKVAANQILSQAELNSRFRGAKDGASNTTTKIKKLSPPGLLGKVAGGVMGTVGEIGEALKGVKDTANDTIEQRNKNLDIKGQTKYEKKRQVALKQQRGELQNQRRADREARRRQGL